uniref:Uncharacterized protein n=1 Tax=Tanacetum cinerariifolium TaxID=118510 RepID=A0A699UJG6_TANCI|nr:hypothetical protein [Tanacetum cinerariifolium]
MGGLAHSSGAAHVSVVSGLRALPALRAGADDAGWRHRGRGAQCGAHVPAAHGLPAHQGAPRSENWLSLAAHLLDSLRATAPALGPHLAVADARQRLCQRAWLGAVV